MTRSKMHNNPHRPTLADNSVPQEAKPGLSRKAWYYALRAIRWRCPLCGISPLFLPLRRVEGVTDWLETLDGCPRCDYHYHREPGYFLLALWVINFWIVAILGVVEVLILDRLFDDIPTGVLILIILISMWGLGILTARHTKALFLALDHFLHPHQDEAK